MTLDITSVSPAKGSIAGGTFVTVSGAGFPYALETDPYPGWEGFEAVVVLKVNTSTTFPSGAVLCDVVPSLSNETAVVCRSREHCSTNAGPTDPSGRNCIYHATKPNDVEVTICPKGLSDMNKLRCWSMGSTPRAICRNAQDGCKFSYAVPVTPVVSHVTDNEFARVGGMPLTLVGVQLQDITYVTVGGQTCSNVVVNENGTIVTCVMPDLASGVYRVRAWEFDGEHAIMNPNNNNNGISVTYAAVVAGVVSEADVPDTISPYYTSLAGGKRVVLRDWFGAGFTANRTDLITVTLGSSPCKVLAVSEREVTCETESVMGRVKVMYYLQKYGEYAEWFLPEAGSRLDVPQATTVAEGFTMTWGDQGPFVPGKGSLVPDYFGARFVAYVLANTTGNYTFELYSDDRAKLWIDGRMVLQVLHYTRLGSVCSTAHVCTEV